MTTPPPTPPANTGLLPGDPRRRPIARFLGPAEASGGPFALLGVSPQACTDELVLSGLDRQIDRLSRHPQCDTPEADEVRLALHAAAAQLLDPVVRRYLISRWSGRPVPQPAPAAPAPVERPRPPVALDATRLLEADAILTLGLYGGWNQRALRRLASLAHRRGLSNRQVAETLRGLSRRRGRPRPSKPAAPPRRPTSRLQVAAPPEPSPVRVEPHDDPAQRLLRNAIIFGFLGLVGLAAAITGIILATRNPATPTPVPGPAPVTSANRAPAVPAPEPAPPVDPVTPRKASPPPLPPDSLAAIPREISASTDGLAIDPAAAVVRFEQAIAKLAAHWTSIPKDRLVATHDSIVEFLYRCGQSPDTSLRAVGAISRFAGGLAAGSDATPEEIPPAVWSLGMLTRLGREADLTATTKNAIDAALAAVLGPARSAIEQSFESGVGAALNAWPERLTPTGATAKTAPVSLESWRAWATCVDALAAGDPLVRLRFLLTGLETLLVQGPEANENKSVAAVIAEITSRITWRAEDDSRRWLLRWFADSRISAADLNAVTSTLATRSGAEGVDLTLVLSTSASDNSRAELRERYATVWNLQDSLARDSQIGDWAKLAREAINASFSSISETDDFAAAVVLARLNDAAWWQWRGDGAEAMRVLADVKGPVDQAMTLPERIKQEADTTPDLSDGAWAERYLAARNTPKLRRELIEQLAAAPSIGSTDAEVLAGEAMVGSPQEVRNAAQDLVKRFAESAPVLAAMLERLPKAPRTAAVGDLYAVLAAKPLPGFREPDWPIATRRAIVERLLEALAAESPRIRIDKLSILLAASYRSMAAAAPIPPDQRLVKVQPAAHGSAAEVWRRWRSMADTMVPSSPPPIPIDQLERRRLGRLSQARGMVQAFAAEQTSIAEAMSYIVTCEQPAEAERVRLVLSNLASDRRHAGNVLEQIKVAERAISQLWLIRMQQEPAS